MILIELSTNGYELIAESTSRTKLEEMRLSMGSFESETSPSFYGFSAQDIAGTIEPNYGFWDEYESSAEEANSYEQEPSLIIIPRSIIGRRGDLSVIEALQEKFPLPSMLLERLRELNHNIN